MRSIRLFESNMASWLARRKSFLTEAVFAAAFVLATGAAFAQQGPPKAAEHPAAGHGGMTMGGNMGDMGAMHAKMMADMKAMDDRLDQKLAVMNEANAKTKVEAIAAVINEMATQRKEMMAKMASMHDQMMMMHMGQPEAAAGDHGAHQEKAK